MSLDKSDDAIMFNFGVCQTVCTWVIISNCGAEHVIQPRERCSVASLEYSGLSQIGRVVSVTQLILALYASNVYRTAGQIR